MTLSLVAVVGRTPVILNMCGADTKEQLQRQAKDQVWITPVEMRLVRSPFPSSVFCPGLENLGYFLKKLVVAAAAAAAAAVVVVVVVVVAADEE